MRSFVRNIEEVPSEEVSCGELHLLSTEDDFAEANVVVVEASEEDRLHYHRQATEMYYVLSGKGQVRLNGKHVEVKKGNLIFIPPFTAHSIVPANSALEALTISVPAWKPEDEYEVENLLLFLGEIYELKGHFSHPSFLPSPLENWPEEEIKNELEFALENCSKGKVTEAIKIASLQIEPVTVGEKFLQAIAKSKHAEAILQGLQRTRTEVGVREFQREAIEVLEQND